MVEEPALQPAVLAADRQALPVVAWVGATWSGIETQFRNVVRAAEQDERIRTLTLPVEPHRDDAIERYLRVLPRSTRATLREVWEMGPLYRRRDLSVVWTQLDLPLLPWALTVGAWRRVPAVYSIDATLKQLNAFGPLYDYWGGRSAVRFAVRDALERAFLRRMALLTPWSEWAARSMREDYGIDPDRVRVLPPGIDLSFWHPAPALRDPARTPRAIFVGGDFERKGGDLLLEVFRRRFRGRLELDLVTRADVPEEPGVRVHTGLGPNDPRLRALYQGADFLVLPTRADCFSMAGMEALGCGLPLILGRTGGAAEVFEDGRQGFYVEPDDGDGLGVALERLVDDVALRLRLGRAGRDLAERRYDSVRNAGRLVGWLAELAVPPAARLRTGPA